MDSGVMDPERLVKGFRGNFRWVYEVRLLSDTMIPLALLKVLLLGCLFPVLLLTVLALAEGDLAKEFFEIVKVYFGLAGIMLGLLAIGYYLVFIPVMGNRYCILFEMNDKEISHIEMKKSVKRTELLAMLGMLAGAAAGNPAVIGANILGYSRKQMNTKFSNVRKIVLFRKRNCLKLISSDMTRNLVYIQAGDYPFVSQFIIERCNNASIKGK